MDTQTKSTTDAPAGVSARQAEHIQAELIHFIYKQSYIGILITVISAPVLTYLIWRHVDHRLLNIWSGGIVLMVALRTVLVHQYHHLKIPSHRAKFWGRLNVISLALAGALWGATMIIIFPAESLPHQLCIALFLCGIIATAISLYAVMPVAVFAFSFPIFLAWIVRFLTLGDPMHVVLAGMAALFMATVVLTSTRISQTRRQLLIARFNLANRVTERSRALKETNAYLQTEIKERKTIEERLRQERDRLETITTTIGAGLAVISKKYRTLWTNRIFKEIFGEAVGKPCYQTQYRQDSVCEECGARMVFEQGYEKVVHERQCPGPDGKPMWFQVVTTPIRNAEGRIRAALELVLPITERKEAEAAQQRMSEKLEEARKTEAIGTLAGGIAHQFNNALAVITGNVELMEHDYQNDPHISAYSNPINSATKRMVQLTSQLLAYAKGGKYKEHLSDMSEVVQSTLSFVKHTIPDTITVNTMFKTDLPWVKIDTTQIQMVVSSIVSNAVEASEPNGQINIFCKSVVVTGENREKHSNIPPGRYVSFVTADTGMGMDEETIKRIFEPFFTTKFEGRGLGMAAVYGIIKNHGGHIHVTSQPEEGTEVRIYLPAQEDSDTPLADGKDLPIKGSGTILMVEDEVDIVEINQAWLKRIGYSVIIATTAHEAIEIICHTEVQFDAVLLDLVLPDMDGAAIYPHIREHRPLAKVIICSGYDQDGSTQKLLDAGADGFLHKPFTLIELSKILNQVLQPERKGIPKEDNSPFRN
ncbi:MAG: response regulator [Desulfobacteraceae bacterium]|jgi:PAS domain S-box-containing protein